MPAPPPAADPAPVNPYQQAPAAPAPPPADAIRPVSLDCSQRADGIHVEQPCQDHYFSCANGLAHQFACAPGTLFDPNTQSCEFADASEPRGYQFLPRQGHQQSQQQQLAYGQQPQLQQSPPSIPVAPVASVQQQQTLLTTNVDCSRQADGFYEQCANGLAFAQQCQAGLVFRIDRCEFPADCANPPQPIAPEAPAQSDLSITIVTTQTSEASCASLTDGNHQVSDCSQDLLLGRSGQNNFCDHRENVAGCNNLAAQEDAPEFSCGAKLPGFYGSGCSGTYFHCDGGISITLACPAGLLFSEATQRCDHRESVA
ncbi:Chitin binding Peritrophin-A domain containing protein, partial [Aphelenchoides avenae]